MKQFKDKERQETTSNGYAHDYTRDMEQTAERRVKEMASMANKLSPEARGLGILAGGLGLLAYTLGYFSIFNYALMAVAIAAIAYGATTSHIWTKIMQGYEYLKNTFFGKSNYNKSNK